jgi:hypothetical protein
VRPTDYRQKTEQHTVLPGQIFFHGRRRTLALMTIRRPNRVFFVPCRPAVPSNSLPIIVRLQA